MSVREQLDFFVSSPLPPPIQPSRTDQRERPAPVGTQHNVTELLARGWTPLAIRRFLGHPDAVLEKVRGGWDLTEHLFEVERVARAESTEEFRAWLTSRDARRSAVARGRARRCEEAASWSPSVPRMSLENLRQLAISHFNERLFRQAERRDFEGPVREATADSDPGFLARIMVNYLRHTATRYDQVLDKLDRLGQRGLEVKAKVKHRALQAIEAAYPELAAECAEQARR